MFSGFFCVDTDRRPWSGAGEDEDGVLPAEPERVADRDLDAPGLRRAATTSMSIFGSGSSWLAVGGTMACSIARTVSAASIAPAAPSVCPTTPLAEVTAGAPPNRSRTTAASAASLSGVEVPCALTWPTSSGFAPASARASRTARRTWVPSGSGAVMWWASAEAPYPASRARIRAPRARAAAARSRTRTPLPSPMTKPSRPASKGREAAAGSAVRRESAPIRANPATSSGVTGARCRPR